MPTNEVSDEHAVIERMTTVVDFQREELDNTMGIVHRMSNEIAELHEKNAELQEQIQENATARFNQQVKLDNQLVYIEFLLQDNNELREENARLHMQIGALEALNSSAGAWEGDDSFALSEDEDV